MLVMLTVIGTSKGMSMTFRRVSGDSNGDLDKDKQSAPSA